MKNLKTLLNFRKINNLDVEDPRNFPNAKRLLTGEAGQQILAMVAEANHVLGMFPPMVCFNSEAIFFREVPAFCPPLHV